LTIRRLDERLKARLRMRGAARGRSMEEEARQILQAALSAPTVKPPNIADSIRELFAPLGGVELPELPDEMVKPPGLG
jgi:antitoxin FitA